MDSQSREQTVNRQVAFFDVHHHFRSFDSTQTTSLATAQPSDICQSAFSCRAANRRQHFTVHSGSSIGGFGHRGLCLACCSCRCWRLALAVQPGRRDSALWSVCLSALRLASVGNKEIVDSRFRPRRAFHDLFLVVFIVEQSCCVEIDAAVVLAVTLPECGMHSRFPLLN